LGALADNGGPTRTMLPSTASPVVNAGSNAMVPAELSNDQRGVGYGRVSGGTVDIGAVERDDAAPTVAAVTFAYLTGPQALRYTFSENVSASLAVADLTLKNLTSGTTVAGPSISL